MNDATKMVLGIVGGVLALVLLSGLFAGFGMFGTGPMMWGFDDGPGGMMGTGIGSWWMLVPILFWAGLLALIGWAVIHIFPADRSGSVRRDPAEKILRERFAHGEIDREEYARSLDTLHGGQERKNKESSPR